MTEPLTLVILATQFLLANTRTRELHLGQIFRSARHLLLIPAAITLVLQSLCTRGTLPRMAFHFALVNFTIPCFFANALAQHFLVLRAKHRLGGGTATAAPLHRRLTRGTGTRMAKQRTRMITARLAAAQLSATVRHIVPIVLGILLLFAETKVVARHFPGQILARRTPPTIVRLGPGCPFDGAVQVEDVVAVLAVPRALEGLDRLAADQALQLTGIDLDDLFLALRNIRRKVEIAIWSLQIPIRLIIRRPPFRLYRRWRCRRL